MENKKDIFELLAQSKVRGVEVEAEMKKSFIGYAMAVNVSRAIPDVRDGLKPVHRRILFTMHELGLTFGAQTRKSSKIVGDVMGNYHPHGDGAIYDALVRMAQDFSLREKLIQGQGNFGSADGYSAAASRYTEAKMSKISAEMIRDIEKNTVDFVPNYDDTRKQPDVLPSRFPNILVNGADGIAVGMATSIPPHNLAEVIEATVALLDNPDIDLEDLLPLVPAPDFPTGGIIMGRSGAKRAYRTGRGSVILRAKTHIEERGGKFKIVVTEFPYQVNKRDFLVNLSEMCKQKRIEGISNAQDESDKDGIRVVIDVKKEASPEVVLNTLYKHTALQISYSMIMLALTDRTPKILNLKQILEAYVAHQKEVVVRRTQFDLHKAQERQHLVEGFIIAQANIDEVIKIIRSTYERADTVGKLMQSFELSERQANAICDMRLIRLNGLEVEKLHAEHAELAAAITEYEDILAHPHRVTDIVKTELLEVKDKFENPRRSEISLDLADIENEDLIEREDVIISMTHMGYVKRIPLMEYKTQRRGGVGITAHKTRDEDFVKEVFTVNTHDYLLYFTNFGKVYRIKAYQIPEASRHAKGRNIINILPLAQGEKVNAVVPMVINRQPVDNTKPANGTQPAESGAQTAEVFEYLVLATRHGLIKKTPLSEYQSIFKAGKIAIKLNDGDELIAAILTSGADELLLASSGGKCIRFDENKLRSTGRVAMGVKSIKLDKDEIVVDLTVVNEASEVLTVTENGWGKRCDIAEYRLTNRGGKGIKAGALNEKTGRIVNLKLITPEHDIMLITDTGIVIRTPASSISKIGRNTQGVRLMRLKSGKVTSVAVVPQYEEPAAEQEEPEA